MMMSFFSSQKKSFFNALTLHTKQEQQLGKVLFSPAVKKVVCTHSFSILFSFSAAALSIYFVDDVCDMIHDSC